MIKEHNESMQQHDESIAELESNMSETRKTLKVHDDEMNRIDYIKTNIDRFEAAQKKNELQSIQHNMQIKKNLNHIRQLDNFMNLYIPIKLQE